MRTFATPPRSEPSRPRPCALCGSSSFHRLWRLEGYAFVRCSACGLIQQNPQPEASAVLERYAGPAYLEYESARQFDYRALELRALEDLDFEAATAELRARARAEGRSPRLLDIGCATGALLDALRTSWEVLGVEASPEQAAYGRERYGLDIRAGTVESAGLQSASLEVVHASQLIEHLNEPGLFLDEVRRILRPDGVLVLATPNADGFQARLLKGRWRSAINDHLYLFARDTLKALLSRHGFVLCREVTWGGWAAGLPAPRIKPGLDAWAKRTGRGDVMALLARPEVG